VPYDSFSRRIRKHPAIAVTSSSDHAGDILAVKDQILVCFTVGDDTPLQAVEGWCLSNGIYPTPLTTVFDSLLPPVFDDQDQPVDAMIYKLIFPRNSFPDIFAVVDALRNALPFPPGTITPNHVLVPAPYSNHSCPSGSPKPILPRPALPPPAPPVRQVTVIDSGYQWHAVFGPNPLGVQPYFRAERLKRDTWIPEDEEQLNSIGGNSLDALAGHANFIAGMIRQRCLHAQVTIWDHNGGFKPTADDFPTEAAVVRSLYQSVPAEVIDLGFAFVTFRNQISLVWRTALAWVGQSTPVVAPVGNQSVNWPPRYPAALSAVYPNVIGVASSQMGTRSAFSNHGAWVTCSANGENVHSTFLAAKGVPEDSDGSTQLTFHGWAEWNGTSFAAPKVVAAIANGITTGVDGLAAWKNLIAPLTPVQDLGYVLDKLLP